jgi:hypothetical protein
MGSVTATGREEAMPILQVAEYRFQYPERAITVVVVVYNLGESGRPGSSVQPRNGSGRLPLNFLLMPPEGSEKPTTEIALDFPEHHLAS